jgi:hypothetical protein
VKYSKRKSRFEFAFDGTGLANQVGTVLLAEFAD